MQFRLLTPISQATTIAEGRGIRQLAMLNERYGRGHWRKRKGVATVETASGEIIVAEIHWYEAHGIGKRKMKIKGVL